MIKEPILSIIGGTIWGNRGAESMLVTTIGRVRADFPNARFNVFSYYPVKDRELVKDENITILSGKPLSLVTRHFFGALIGAVCRKFGGKLPGGEFFKIARAMADSNVLLDIGGITFSDGREKYLPFNILTIWPAMMLGVPVVKLAQAVGPFNNLINHFFARLFLFQCEHIFARGEKTSQFLDQLELPEEKFTSVADIAFSYEPKFSLSTENENKVNEILIKLNKIKKKRIIVISPSVLINEKSQKINQDYCIELIKIINQLGTDNYHFLFLPNATREGSIKKQNNDLLIIESIRNEIISSDAFYKLADGSDFISYDINTKSIRKLISVADLLITSRYHSMISGLCLQIPTIVIGWGHKYKETLSAFSLDDYYIDFRMMREFAPVVNKALGETKRIKAIIQSNLEQVEKKSNSQFEWLLKGFL